MEEKSDCALGPKYKYVNYVVSLTVLGCIFVHYHNYYHKRHYFKI